MSKRKDKEIKQQRDDDLLDAFYSVYSNSKEYRPLPEILQETVNQKSKRFYVSSIWAYNVVCNIKNGQDISSMSPNKQRMFKEIYRLTNEALSENKKNGIKLPLLHVVETVVEEEAPCFYLTPQSAGVILSIIRKRRRCGRRS